MKKKRVSVKVVVLSVMWPVLLLSLSYIYMDARKTMIASLNVALEDAILKDYRERHDEELKYSSGRLGRKVKGVTVVTEKGEENFEFKDSIDEAMADRLAAQYMLAQIHPIHPDTLNGLMQEELKKYAIESETGIIYTYNGKSQYSKNDSLTIHRSSVHFDISRTLDIKKTVRVQAWIDMPLGTVVKNMHDGAFWSLLLFFGILLWASFSSWEVEDPDKVKFGKMLLNKEAKKMTIDGKECPLRNQEFQLLLMFVEKPDHTLSREEIKNAFWKEEQGVDNRVSNLISTLRGSLKEYQGYQIVTEGNVFRLWTN
ncbi:MAG: response regulator transcription factor [Bacteroides sp.]|nr:response regulator transcription factor [Bacteroides sp.]